MNNDVYDRLDNSNNCAITIGGTTIYGLTREIAFSRQCSLTENKICSFYMLFVGADEKFMYDKRILSFGEYCVVIKEPRQLVHRLQTAIHNNGGTNFEYGGIEYMCTNYEDEYGIRKKRDEFRWQNEFRVIYKSSAASPVFIDIGCIADIAYQTSLKGLLSSTVRIQEPKEN